MKFIILYIFAIIIYITIITLIILKIKDINNHPTKYENKELEIKGNNLERTKNYCHFYLFLFLLLLCM